MGDRVEREKIECGEGSNFVEFQKKQQQVKKLTMLPEEKRPQRGTAFLFRIADFVPVVKCFFMRCAM